MKTMSTRAGCPSCDRDLSYPGAPGHECYPYLREQDLLGIEIQQPKRPPLAETPLSFHLGDEVHISTHEEAIALARKRAIERDCRQQVCIFSGWAVGPTGWASWAVQDVR